MMSRRFIILGMIGVGLLAMTGGYADAGFPDKPITIVVPWAPGGTADLMSRSLAKPMSEELKQPVIVINKPGAAGVTGTLELEKTAPDGYTIGPYSISQALTQYTSPNPTNLANIVPIAEVMTTFATLTVNAGQPWNTLGEFIAYAKANPGKIRNANSGKGASSHIFAEAFDKIAGIKEIHVPFGGYAPAMTAVAGGHIEATCTPVADVQAMAKAGKVRILAVAAEERQEPIAMVPTMKELKINLVIDNWVGLVAPRGTPPEIIDILDKAIDRSLKKPEVAKTLRDMGYVIIYRNHTAFSEWLKTHDLYLRGLCDSLGLWVAPRK
jgi:tripartite-type tricarboxylate transporter receptor subunit TctC